MNYYDLDLLSDSRLEAVRCLKQGEPIRGFNSEKFEFTKQLREAILEPNKYFKNLLIEPDYKKHKFKIATMARIARENTFLRYLLSKEDLKIGAEVFFEEAKYNLKCKTKINIWADKSIAIIKTTDASTLEDFIGTIYKYNLCRRAAFDMDATGAEKFVIFGIEKKYPHRMFTVPLALHSEAIEDGRKEYEELIDSYLEMKQDGKIDFKQLMK